MRKGLLTFIESRIKLNEPIKNSFKYLDTILKHLYFIQRMLMTSSNSYSGNKLQSRIQVNKTDTISFYESLEGKNQKFPSMVDKVAEIEEMKVEQMRKNFVKLDKKTRGDWLQSDFEVFDITISPRTKRRIKRNKEDAGQLRQMNFHEKFYVKMIMFEKHFFSLKEEDKQLVQILA